MSPDKIPEEVLLSILEDLEKSKKELEQEKEFTDNALNAQRDTFFVFNAKTGKAIKWNKNFRKVSGYSDKEIAKLKAPNAYYSKEDLEKAAGYIKKLVKGTATTIELNLITKKGKKIQFEYNASLIYNEKKEPLIISIGRDVTERKKAEEELIKSEENYRSIFDNSNDAIFVHDAKTGKILDVNNRMLKMFGYSYKEALKLDVGKISSGKSQYTQKDAVKWVKKAMKGGIQTFEWYAKRKNGELFWDETTLKRINVGGQEKIIAVVKDITERKKAEEELIKLAAIPEYNTELVNMATPDGKMVYLNKAGGKMLGISEKEVKKHKILEVIPKQFMPIVINELIPALSKGKTWQGELKYKNLKTGKLIDVHAMAFTIKDPKTGKPKYFANVSRDITEKKRAEEKEFELNEQKRKFIRDASHELKTPITTIMMDVDILKEQCGCTIIDRKRTHEVVDMLHRNVRRLNETVENLLTFEKTEKEALKTHFIKYSINDILDEVIEDLKPLSKVKKIKIIKKVEDIPKGYMDKDQIRRVIINLMDNAIKFSKKNSKIEITLKKQNKNIFFSIKDNGKGLTEKDITNLFTVFYKGHPHEKGTGIGLTISKRIIEKHDGIIWAEQQKKGAKFCFEIPIKKTK